MHPIRTCKAPQFQSADEKRNAQTVGRNVICLFRFADRSNRLIAGPQGACTGKRNHDIKT